MAYQFSCSKVGFDCPYAAEGETEEEVIKKAKQHGKEAHGFTDEELNKPETMEKIKAAIKKT